MKKKKDTPGVPVYSKKIGDKKCKSKSHHSIIHKHETKLNEFRNKEERLKTIDNKIRNIENNLKKYKTELLNDNLDKDYKYVLNDNMYKNIEVLNQLKFDRKYIESGQDELDYLLNSSIIIQEYITLEDKKTTLLGSTEMSNEISDELNKIQSKKNELTESYFSKFDSNYLNQNLDQYKNNTKCVECNLTLIVDKSFLVCPNCGFCLQTIEHSNELSYKELQDYDYRTQFTYDKQTHLEDWLKRFQSKENRSIPQEILDKIIVEANKERIQDLNTLTEDKIKRYLKKLNLNDYYDNVIGIIGRINGRPPFTLTVEIEDKIKSMFQQIQKPYEKFKPPGRKNFLSYSYTLHKFFQILGLHEFAKYFPLLKSIEKLRQQDIIFKKIVAYMAEKDPGTKWVFYPSV